MVWGFFLLSLQDIMFYLVKTKPHRAALSESHHGVQQLLCQEGSNESPGWVAKNLCATEC